MNPNQTPLNHKPIPKPNLYIWANSEIRNLLPAGEAVCWAIWREVWVIGLQNSGVQNPGRRRCCSRKPEEGPEGMFVAKIFCGQSTLSNTLCYLGVENFIHNIIGSTTQAGVDAAIEILKKGLNI